MNINDRLIIGKLKEGDKAVFRLVFDRNYDLLRRFAIQILKDPCQAEEIADDVIVYLWEYRETLSVDISLRSYLMQAVKNRCIDVLRSARHKCETSFTSVTPEDNLEFLDVVFSDDTHPMDLLIRKELERNVLEAIGKLPPVCRLVFEKSRFESKRYEEIADELHISVNTVKYHIKYALTSLRKSLLPYLKIYLFFFLFS